jgi:hypothetical protein
MADKDKKKPEGGEMSKDDPRLKRNRPPGTVIPAAAVPSSTDLEGARTPARGVPDGPMRTTPAGS